jgi:stage V sporulation protein AD
MSKKHGRQTCVFERAPLVLGWASVVGPKEGEGPHRDDFDRIMPDYYMQKKSWEAAESAMLTAAVSLALAKARVGEAQVDLFLGGDLLNQIMPSNLAARALARPFFGLFGACSTLGEALILAGMALDGGFCRHTVAAVSSHHYTAGRQYRLPSEQGFQPPLYSQYTVTGAGALVLARNAAAFSGVRLIRATAGKVVDKGQRDPANMGAAMAGAAVDTLKTHFEDLSLSPDDYDLILTGDLGRVGLEVFKAWWKETGLPPLSNLKDCGALIFSEDQNDVFSGGSGCGCSASMLCGPILKRLQAGSWNRILLVPTGALMSPTTCYQGETIPGLAHAVALEKIRP